MVWSLAPVFRWPRAADVDVLLHHDEIGLGRSGFGNSIITFRKTKINLAGQKALPYNVPRSLCIRVRHHHTFTAGYSAGIYYCLEFIFGETGIIIIKIIIKQSVPYFFGGWLCRPPVLVSVVCVESHPPHC